MPGFLIGNMEVTEGALSQADYYMNYTWTIPNLFGKTSRDVNNDNGKNAFINVKDCTTPTFTVNKETYIPSNLEYKYAKSVTWDDIKISWYDTVGLIDLLREWRRSIWTSGEGLKYASEYRKNTQLSCFLPDKSGVFGWILRNSWPSIIRNGDLTYTSSDVKIVEVTVTYDWADEHSEASPSSDFIV